MPDKRRLLVVSHGFPPYYGGAEHAAGHLAAAAVSSGRWEVDVLTSDIGGRLPARERWRGVNVVRVPARKKKWANHNVVELHSFLRSASRNMEIRRPDWILAHFTLPGGEVARRWAGRFGVPYAVVLHGADVPDSQKRRFGAVYPLIKPLVRRVWRQAARVIAVSDGLRELALRTWPGGRIEVVPNGVDIERFRPAEMPTVRDGGTLVVVAVARLVEIKGLQHLIAALARIPADMRSQIRLRLCGTGPYEGELRRQVREAGLDEQVEFAGLIAYDEIPRQLRQSDVFVLPSLQEGLPLSLLEAMASGLPVVATAVGGIPGVVKDGVNGLLVPAAAPAALRDALVRLLANPALRQRLGTAARRDSLDWSWAAVWERYEALLSPAT
jgi:glycosyltransferase involved in cell wall biosynthesis